VLGAAMASRQLLETVPFYEGLTLEQIGGRGARWQEHPAASRLQASPPEPAGDLAAQALSERAGRGQAGDGSAWANEQDGYRSVWDAPEVRFSPALEFLATQRELV